MKKIVLEFPDEKKIEIEEPKDYNSLKEKIEELEKDILCDYRIQYIDEDNDTILITNNEDYSNFLESNSNRINFFGKDNMTNTTTTLTNIDFTNFNKMTRVSETDESENKNNEIINLNNNDDIINIKYIYEEINKMVQKSLDNFKYDIYTFIGTTTKGGDEIINEKGKSLRDKFENKL
jgi:hypothetical protein